MATVNGVVYQVYQGPPTPNTWLSPGYVDGRKKVNLDFYVGLGTEGAGTVINMGALLPAGAKVLSVSVHTSAATGGLTISVGDLNSATRYGSASTGPAAKGITSFTGLIDPVNGFYLIGQNPASPTALNNDQQIIFTTGGATLGVGTIYGMEVNYTTD